MLGEAVYEHFSSRCITRATDVDLNESWLGYLDVSDKKQVFEFGRKIKPDFLIHLAALTDMEYCELHPDEAYNVNSYGTENMVNLAREFNAPLVYISTAGIFDGKKDEYSEDDNPVPPAPLSVYGKTKYNGELAARVWPRSIIIRAGWMMGGGPGKDKKFINKLIKQIRADAREIAVVDDKFGTPCYTYDLAKIIEYLIDGELYGLYHGVCDGSGGSRYDVAAYLIHSLNIDQKVNLREVDSDYFKEKYFAPRPPSERLNNAKIKSLNPSLVRDWHECLREYVNKFDWGLKDIFSKEI